MANHTVKIVTCSDSSWIAIIVDGTNIWQEEVLNHEPFEPLLNAIGIQPTWEEVDGEEFANRYA